MLWILVLGTAVGVGATYAWARSSSSGSGPAPEAWVGSEDFRLAGQELGVAHGAATESTGDRLEGPHGHLTLRATRGPAGGAVEIELRGLRGPLAAVTVLPRQRSGEADVRKASGDPALDAVALVTGPRQARAAGLEASVRATLVSAMGLDPVSLEKGVLRVRWSPLQPDPPSAGPLVARIRSLAALADELEGRGSQVGRLARVLEADPLPALRDRAARVLLSHHADEPEAMDAALYLLQHPDKSVALTASLHSAARPQGLARLVQLATETGLTSQQRLRVAQALVETHPDVAVRVARNLAGQHRLRESARRDAIALLDAHGTVAEVPTLLPIRDEGPLSLREPADQAILAIQDRLSGAAAGALTVAASDDQSGELSVARQAQEGALAVSPKDS